MTVSLSISWKTEKGEWFQFRCDSPSLQSKWLKKLKSVQKHCLALRRQNGLQNDKRPEPTLFAFKVRKPLDITADDVILDVEDQTEIQRGIKSNQFEEHYFCTTNFKKLEQWKMTITQQIHLSHTAGRVRYCIHHILCPVNVSAL